MIGWSAIVDLAMDCLVCGSDSRLVIELAGLQKTEAYQVGELLKKLAATEDFTSQDPAKDKWLYLNLLWLFENKANFSDPLSEVEKIYADFDYPSNIEGFVRYMPVVDGYNPKKHSKNENEERLFKQWEKYLNNTKNQFGK